MNILPHLAKTLMARNVPLGSTIELLAPCNLHCTHCYVTHSKKNRLTLPVLVDLFDQMAEAGSFSVSLTGGEIGLRKDLFQIIEAARQRYFAIRLLSTGTLWREQHWDRIAELAVQDVRMSVYAVDAAVHDTVTCTPGSHTKTMTSVMGLRERGVNVTLACPIMATNAHEVLRVVELGEQLGVDVAIDPRITWTDASNETPATTRASVEQIAEVYRDERVRKRFAPSEQSCAAPQDDDTPCSVGRQYSFIQCTGDVLPCSNWPRSCGNVLEQRYLDIWRNSLGLGFARSVSHKMLTGCDGCGDRGDCHPCIAMNLQERGSVALPAQTTCDSTAAQAIAFFGASRQQQHGGHARLRVVA